jgi:hypothetical protein
MPRLEKSNVFANFLRYSREKRNTSPKSQDSRCFLFIQKFNFELDLEMTPKFDNTHRLPESRNTNWADGSMAVKTQASRLPF